MAILWGETSQYNFCWTPFLVFFAKSQRKSFSTYGQVQNRCDDVCVVLPPILQYS